MSHGQDWVQLAQLMPTDTNAATLFAFVRGFQYECIVVVANVDNGSDTYRVFHDADGTTYSTATAIAYDAAVAGGEVDVVPSTGHIRADGDQGGSIGVRSSAGSGVTFTLYGIREKKA